MASDSIRPEIPATPLDAAAIIVVDGRERPVRNSLDHPLHWSEEGVRNFWRWFGDSKAVDSDGRPLVVYHATNEKFTEFKKGEKDGLSGKGIYFSEYPLGQFGENVMSVYLRILAPITRQTEMPGMREINSAGIPTKMVADVFDKFPEFDGVINRMDITVKSPSQIKSAIDNSGLFDPASDHLADPVGRPELAVSTQRVIEGNASMTNGVDATSDKDDITGTERNDSVVLIEPGQMAAFQKRLDGLNKKAVSFGLDPIKIINTKDVLYERKIEYVGRDMDRQLSYLVPVRDEHWVEHPVMLKRIEIEYPEVKLGNWRVVGKLEAMDGGNLTFSISQNAADVEALSTRADHPIECEHCKTNRYRKDGYLLRDNESGDYKQVGSNCLEDFTGIDPAAALFLARMSDVVRVAEGELEEFGRSGRVNAVSTRQYLAAVSFVAENMGFISSAKARETGDIATYESALRLSDLLRDSKELHERYGEQVERHRSHADAVRDWVATKPEESTFDRNVKLLLQNDAIALDRKHLAFAAAAVPMYNRTLAAEADARKPSEHVGTPGQKMTAVTLTVDRVLRIDTHFGVSDLVLMHDQDGNKFKWKTSACPQEVRDSGVGRSMEASFKVKEHDDYKGKAQTVITNLKVQRWLDLEHSAPASADDAAEHEPPTVLYRTSIFRHPNSEPRDFSTAVIDSMQLTSSQLIAEARDRGIDQLRGEGEFMWYGSAPDDLGKAFSLYVHDIDGREPVSDDYQQIADLLGVERECRAEVDYPAHT